MQVIISPQVLLCIRLALRACLCVESMFSSVNCAKRIGSKAPLLLKVEFGVSQASNCDKTLFPPLSDYTGVGWQYRTSIVMVWRLEKSIYTRTHTYMYTTQHESKGWESPSFKRMLLLPLFRAAAAAAAPRAPRTHKCFWSNQPTNRSVSFQPHAHQPDWGSLLTSLPQSPPHTLQTMIQRTK